MFRCKVAVSRNTTLAGNKKYFFIKTIFTGSHKAEIKHLYHPLPSPVYNIQGSKARPAVEFREILSFASLSFFVKLGSLIKVAA